MFSFIRKRLPSKDRTFEHSLNTKTNDQSQDDLTKTSTLSNTKKKKKIKRKEISLSNDNVSNPSSDNYRINKPYSDVDYFPLMPGALSHSINHQIFSNHSDPSSDSYFNPSEIVQKTNNLNYVQTKEGINQVMQIPVIDSRQEQQVPSYKDLDHLRTRAWREVAEQRSHEKSIK